MSKIVEYGNIPEYTAFFSCSMTGLPKEKKEEIYNFLLKVEKKCQEDVDSAFHAFIPYREEDNFYFASPKDYYKLDTMAVEKSKIFVVFDFHQLYSYGVGVEAKTADDSNKPILIVSIKPEAISVMLTGMNNFKEAVKLNLNGKQDETLISLVKTIKTYL